MITIIIPFFNQNSYRKRNLDVVVANFRKNYPDFDILIIEQRNDESTEIIELGDKCRIYQINCEFSNFNKSFLINKAIKEFVKTDIIMMSDADCILPAKDTDFFIQNLKDVSIFFPFSRVNFLNEGHTRRFIANKPLIQVSPKQDHFINRYTGLVNVFTRETFEIVGGFDESFEGWGGEDDAFVDKCNRLVNPIKRSEDEVELLHLYHPKNNTSEYLKSECFTWNKLRVATIRRMSNEDLQNYVNEMKIGNNILDDIVRKFEKEGKLGFSAELIVGSGKITMDTTVYDVIPIDGKVELDSILDAVYRTDGKGFLSSIIQQIDDKIVDLNDEETKIINKYRSMCS